MSQLEKTGKPTTVYLNPKAWSEYKTLVPLKLNKSASKRLRELISKDLAELKGVEVTAPVDYDDLKRQHHLLIRDIDQIEKTLRKHGVYDQLVDLAENLKIDKTNFSNLKNVVRDMFNQWEGHQEELHLFVSLLELVKEKRGIEHELKQIRLERAAGSSRRKTEE